MIRATRGASVAVLISCGLFGQSSAPTKRFEVASIKANRSVTTSSNQTVAPGGRLSVTNATIKSLIQWSYGLRSFQISGGPGWLDSDRFDIEAKPEGRATDQDVMQMLQTLLAERFKVAVHSETKEMPVYALAVGKNGPKLREVKEDDTTSRQGLRSGNGHVAATKSPMTVLARVLSANVGRTVVDRTGLTGKYDFTLDWTPDQGTQAPDTPGPSIFAALQEQLGLKLEATRGPVEMLVIDHAEKIPTEN